MDTGVHATILPVVYVMLTAAYQGCNVFDFDMLVLRIPRTSQCVSDHRVD